MVHLRYRPEIDGLRAAAVGGVLLFHAGVPHFEGGFLGVDVFFVISGYLITSLLLAEFDVRGRIDFVKFWARRTRRILPSALLVIGATLVSATFVVSDLKLFYAARDAIYAALYITNWQQLVAALDYFDSEAGQGLFVHYWSLAVEEQFYLFLTVVFALQIGSFRLLAKRSTAPQRLLIGLLGASGLASLIIYMVLSVDDPIVAFFATHARIWELCIGAGACLLERSGWTPAFTLRSFIAWLGAIAIAVAFLGYQLSADIFLGAFTVLAVVGAASFILAGINTPRRLPIPLSLGAATIPVAIGKLSYALYLWHWPVFELYKGYFGSWSVADQVVAVGVTVVLSIASHVAIENPIRFGKRLDQWPLRSIGAAAACTLVIVISATILHRDAARQYIVLRSGVALHPEDIRRDLDPRLERDRCQPTYQVTESRPCIYGKTDSSRRMFLVGDSHAAQWFPVVNSIAKGHGMALYVRIKSSCTAVETPVYHGRLKRRYYECDRYRENMLDEIDRLKPEIVIIAQAPNYKPISPEGSAVRSDKERIAALAEGERALIRRLSAAGTGIVMIADTPYLPEDPVDCLFEHAREPKRCRWPCNKVLRDRFPWSFSPDAPPPGVAVIDMLDTTCWNGFCYAAVDDYVIMRDAHHLTRSFMKSITREFEARFEKALSHLKAIDRQQVHSVIPSLGRALPHDREASPLLLE